MNPPRIDTRPAFTVTGKKTWISGQENSQFGDFWVQCRADGLFDQFYRISRHQPGRHTNGLTLGISLVADDPANRSFYYMIAVEKPENTPATALAGLETYTVPAATWAIFPSHGKMPDALVTAEIYALTEWLPTSGYRHAAAPEMEVYPPQNGTDENAISCEFWLPVMQDG